MAVDEPQAVAKRLKDVPIIKPTKLDEMGFLQPESTYVNCPACERTGWSVVQVESVTCLQRLLKATNLCKKWRGRADINHYCTHCGCYIGRFISIGCGERCIARSARRQAAADDMTLKARPKDCALAMQKVRENVLSWREEQRAAKAANAATTTTTTTTTTTIQQPQVVKAQ